MTKKELLKSFLILVTSISLIWTQGADAALPPGNAVKDPYAILRNSLPIKQKDLRELQHKLEDTSYDLRGKRWSALSKATARSKFLVSNRKNQILNSVPKQNKAKAETLLSSLANNLDELDIKAGEKNRDDFIELRRASLREIGSIESLLLTDEFPYKIPEEFNDLPRLLGRATVLINTTKGEMTAVIDGYNAPLTAGAFIDLTKKEFYNKLPINRAEEFFVLQTGDPNGPAIGYIDPDTKQERHVPLEIRIPEQEDTIYNSTFEELGLYTETPVLPFATLGTLGWSHSENSVNDGSSQFFFFLYEAELNPAGRNLIDGRNSAFGYVTEGAEILSSLGVNDQIISIKILDGLDNLKANA